MKANEFVKKYGIEHSKDVANGWITNYENISLADLKRLVESHEIIERIGGLSFAKKCSTEIYGLKQAITDVESCQ